MVEKRLTRKRLSKLHDIEKRLTEIIKILRVTEDEDEVTELELEFRRLLRKQYRMVGGKYYV